MWVNGRLATIALCNGCYLRDIAARTSSHAVAGSYYGVDVSLFKPVDAVERQALRRRHHFPEDRFLIFFSSRISHEKDPETVLRATALVRERGLDAVIVNLGGGFHEFLQRANDLGLPNTEDWMIGRPAVHPMHDLCEISGGRCRGPILLGRGIGVCAARSAGVRHAGGGDQRGRDGGTTAGHRPAHAAP